MSTPVTSVHPDFFQNLPSVVQEKKAQALGVTDEEQHYYGLANHKGYHQLKEYADSLMRDLDNVTAIAMSQGLPFEEIGKNAVVADLAKGVIKRLFDRVEDVKDNIEKPDGTIK